MGIAQGDAGWRVGLVKGVVVIAALVRGEAAARGLRARLPLDAFSRDAVEGALQRGAALAVACLRVVVLGKRLGSCAASPSHQINRGLLASTQYRC